MEILELKNTVKVKGLVTQTARLLRPWDFPGKNTGVHCHFLLQEIFPTQRSNSCLLLAGEFFTTEPPGEPPGKIIYTYLSMYILKHK